MIDANIDPTLESMARERAQRQIRNIEDTYQATGEPMSRRGAIMASRAERLSARGTLSSNSAANVTQTVAVQSTAKAPPLPDDPLASLRMCRIGGVAVVVLLLMWLWIRQSRERVA